MLKINQGIAYIKQLFYIYTTFKTNDMKTKFNNQQIFIKSPLPKVDQIWQNVTDMDLFKVLSVNKEKTLALCEKENGFRFEIGFGWFDGINNFFIGTIF